MKQDKSSQKRYWWFWVAGLFALLWVLLRSGTNPKRLTYPCQQAAFPLASAWVIAVIGLLGGGLFFKKFARVSAAAAVLAGVVFLGVSTSRQTMVPEDLPVWEVQDPVSEVFVMDDIPATSGSLAAGDASVPDEYLVDPAIDTLLAMMEARDIYIHKTAEHPDGIVASADVVVIKGNFQWTSRNTTSTDRIKGLIWQILNHPDGFTGEIIICDNTQDVGTGINDNDNNSEDEEQSIVNVCNVFQAKGYPVYYLCWADFWSAVVEEYSEGDYGSGYTYDLITKISYPKFLSPSGDYYVSLRYGLWDADSETYDSERLCIIDFPVLKAHAMAGATIAVKNWIGVLTTAYYNERYSGRTSMHSTFFWGDYALVAKIMAVTYPRLTIIDATWTTTEGPVNLSNVIQTNMILASRDPVASSWYAAKFILTPIANNPNQTNPDHEGGRYYTSLGNWTNYFRNEAGLPCTKDSAEMTVYDRGVLIPSDIRGSASPSSFGLESIRPNPFSATSIIRYTLPESAYVNLDIIDISGRVARSLEKGERVPGHYSVKWDGRNNEGVSLIPGIYFCRFKAGGYSQTLKVLLIK